MKKRLLLFGTVLIAVFAMWCVPAFATSTSYNIVVPRFGGDAWTSNKTLNNGKVFSVRHQYSGGKKINFTMCNSAHGELGPMIGLYPGGSGAPRYTLWTNTTGAAKVVCVKLETLRLQGFDVLAQGYWDYNY